MRINVAKPRYQKPILTKYKVINVGDYNKSLQFKHDQYHILEFTKKKKKNPTRVLKVNQIILQV